MSVVDDLVGINDIEMQDLLSLCDEVLTELFQYSKPDGIYRFSFHAWLRLRHAMTGLLVERSFNCWNWYHRQLIEASRARYAQHEVVNIYKILGIYFGNIVDDDTRRSRLITCQPIVLSEIPIWYGGSLPNHRRCFESVHSLISAGLYSEAVTSLCDFDYICACCLVGEGFSLVDDICMLYAKLANKLKDEMSDLSLIALVERVLHYSRWLAQDMTLIVESPRTVITASASAQPLQSTVRNDFMNYYILSLFQQPITSLTSSSITSPLPSLLDNNEEYISSNLNNWNDDFWVVATSLGGKGNFSPQLTNFQGHSNRVNCVCFSPDESRVISSSDDKTIKIWDTTSGAIKQTIDTSSSGTVLSLKFSANGLKVFSGSSDGILRIWDAMTGLLLNTLEGHTDAINSLSTYSDFPLLISGSSDTTIKIWDPITCEPLGTLTGHLHAVISVSFHGKRNKVVSGSADRTIRIWNLVLPYNSSNSITLKGHNNAVTSVCFSWDGLRLASGSSDSSLMIWDCSDESSGTCPLLHSLQCHSESISGICWLIDDTKIITSSDDKSIKLWDSTDGSLYHSIYEHVDSITCLNISSSGVKLVTASGILDRVVKVWDLTILGSSVKEEVWEGHSSYILSVAFSSDGKKLLSGSDDKLIKIWDVATRSDELTLTGHTEAVSCVCFGGKDSTLIASGSVDMNVIIWEASSGRLLHTCVGHIEELYSVCFTPDGLKVVSGSSDKNIKIWNSLSGALINTLEGHTSYIFSVSVNINNNKIVSGSYDNTLRVWDINTGETLLVLSGHSKAVRSVAFSPDGSNILSGSDDTTISIWDSDSGNLLHNWIAHDSIIMTVSYSRDGSRILSASVDSRMKIWERYTCKLQHTLIGHSNAVISACFNNDGSRIASGAADRTVRLWETITIPIP